MSDPISVSFVQQPTPHSCVHACLSMITGIPVESLIERFGDNGLNWAQEVTVLVENKIWPHRNIDAGPHPFPLEGVYLATVPSLNIAGRSHRVVIDARSEGYTLYDPNKGRHGRSVYESAGIMTGDISISEVTYLDTSVLTGMRDVVAQQEAA
jgi:hypothetical protein